MLVPLQGHPDPILAKTKVTLETPFTETSYPAIVIRYYERDFKTAGVAHQESIETLDKDGFLSGRYQKYRHAIYHGDVEFAIYALSTYDRDLISDYVKQIIVMGDTESQTSYFAQRVYESNEILAPGSTSSSLSVNSDEIMDFGETQNPTPWGSDDKMVYTGSLRIKIFGEVYSRTQPNFDFGLVTGVKAYPYTDGQAPTPPGPGPDGFFGNSDDVPDPAPWI